MQPYKNLGTEHFYLIAEKRPKVAKTGLRRLFCAFAL